MLTHYNHELNFKNDVVFKYVLSNDKDQDSLFLLDLIITHLIGLDYSSLKVLNPDINPNTLNDKDIVLDILVEDNSGNKMNVEMQQSNLSTYLYQRFQFYGAKILTTQLNEGDSYRLLHPVYQVIFIDDINIAHPCLKEVYTSKNDDGIEERCNLIHRIYIFLPYINEIKKERGLETFTPLEKMIYIFANSIDDDIMEVEEKVVKVMEKKLEAFTKEESLAYLAFQRYMGKWQAHMEREELKEQALREKERGLQEGTQVGKRITIFHLIQMKYPNESLSFLDKCNSEQLDIIENHIFDDITFTELKEFIEKK